MQSLGYEDIQERSGTPNNPASGFLRMFADSSGRIKYVDPSGNVTDIIPAIQQGKYVYAADTGTANAYAVSLTPTPTIQAGSMLLMKASNANSGASTLAVNGGTAAAITKRGAGALTGGEINTGQIVWLVYDGTEWQLVGTGPTISAIQQEAYIYSADSGTANAYAVTLSPAPTIMAGSEVVFQAGHANTGASTLSVNGIVSPLTKNGTNALVSGDIVAGQILTAKRDTAGNWQISGISGGGSGTRQGAISYYLSGLPAAGASCYFDIPGNLTTFQIPGNFSGATGKCGTNPTSAATYTFYKNTASIGTLSISTSGVLTWSTTSGAAVSFIPGTDELSWAAPGTQDATLSDVRFGIPVLIS